MCAAVLGLETGLELTAPFHALFLVVGLGVVEGHVDLDHAGAALEAHLGRGGGARVGAVGLLEDPELAALREGGVEEDVVGGDDGVWVEGVVDRGLHCCCWGGHCCGASLGGN